MVLRFSLFALVLGLLSQIVTGQQPRLSVQTGHSAALSTIAFSPDSRFVITGDGFGVVVIWNVQGQQLYTYRENSSIGDVALSPRYARIAVAVVSASGADSIVIRDLRDGSVVQRITGPRMKALTPCFAFNDAGSLAPATKCPVHPGAYDDIELLSPDGKLRIDFNNGGGSVGGGEFTNTVYLTDLTTGQKLELKRGSNVLSNLAITDAGANRILLQDIQGYLYLWGLNDGREINRFVIPRNEETSEEQDYYEADTGRVGQPVAAISANGAVVASAPYFLGRLLIWDAEDHERGREIGSDDIFGVATSLDLSADGSKLLLQRCEGPSWIVDTAAGRLLKKIKGFNSCGQAQNREQRNDAALSADGQFVLRSGNSEPTNVVNTATGAEVQNFRGIMGYPVALSPDHQIAAVTNAYGSGRARRFGTILLDPTFGRTIATIPHGYWRMAFSSNSFYLVLLDWYDDRQTGSQMNSITVVKSATGRVVTELRDQRDVADARISPDGKYLLIAAGDGSVRFHELATGKEVCRIFSFADGNWVVVSPDGRFDTNNLESINGLAWVSPLEPLKALPLEVFARQYYEPGLLRRTLQCNQAGNCAEEFPPLPSIADLNRVQPRVRIKEVRPSVTDPTSADVTVEVESVTETVTVPNPTRQVEQSSGAYDLRLFRDGQLVGQSTPVTKLEQYLATGPRLTDASEAQAWRETNNVFSVRDGNVKTISATKVEYTFRGLPLPRDGRTTAEFTAYAFNVDRVKSATAPPVKFAIPATVSGAPRKGRAFLISIGVNASENPKLNLNYAANDARSTQEILSARLRADPSYSDVVQVSLISDHDANKNPTETAARKTLIRGVFSLLAGHPESVPLEALKLIPNGERLMAVRPEDTLIITYSGHGYTDRNGNFYLVPFDNGIAAAGIDQSALPHLISSDELALWMRDVTAMNTVLVIDACFSSTAVQGAGFKPGPMGSRGLGQLAYDKDMKILSATQADNIALELGKLQHGLLTYALVLDGVEKLLANRDSDHELSATEWLSYPTRRVPELYQEIRSGRLTLVVDDKVASAESAPKLLLQVGAKQPSNLNLQQPALFDFKRRNRPSVLFHLP